MLFEHANERRFVHEPWSRQNELMVESEDQDAARGVEAFLGFSVDDNADSTVFIRAKILYEAGSKTQICNLDDSRGQLSMLNSQGRRNLEIR